METIEVINRTTRTLLPALYLASLLSVVDKTNAVGFTCQLAKEGLLIASEESATLLLPWARTQYQEPPCSARQNHPDRQNHPEGFAGGQGPASPQAGKSGNTGRHQTQPGRENGGAWPRRDSQIHPMPLASKSRGPVPASAPLRFLTPPGPQGCRRVSCPDARRRHRGDGIRTGRRGPARGQGR